MFTCVWCGEKQATETTKDCQWIEPGGVDVVVVTDVPAIDCQRCQDVYIDDDLNFEIEQALNSVDLDKLGLRFSYEQLMKAPKLNIFEQLRNGASFKCP